MLGIPLAPAQRTTYTLMTTPTERTRALHFAADLLQQLASGGPLPSQEELRRQATVVFRHYPDHKTIDRLAMMVQSGPQTVLSQPLLHFVVHEIGPE